MVTAHGPTSSDLNPLSQSIREYNLFAGVNWVLAQLQASHPERTLDLDALYARLEFQGHPSLAFPGSELNEVTFFRERGELRARLSLNVLSLSSAGTPLPAPYIEQALESPRTQHFLDWFNNRLQRLLLPIWQKYRYHASYRRHASDPMSQHAFSFIGLGHSELRANQDLDSERLLPYLGLISLRTHSAALIESVLRFYFKQADLHIQQCQVGEEPIREASRNRAGLSNSRLGHDLVIGLSVIDRAGKFRIDINQLSWERFHQFLPVGKHFAPLCALTRFTLRDALIYDIRLQLKHEAIQALRLEENGPCQLGWTAWLDHQHADGVVTFPAEMPAWAVPDATPTLSA